MSYNPEIESWANLRGEYIDHSEVENILPISGSLYKVNTTEGEHLLLDIKTEFIWVMTNKEEVNKINLPCKLNRKLIKKLCTL